MAQAPLSVDNAAFSCSICLELLRDPVTIPCGHSYCMSCLTRHWDRQQVCSCPQCRATFSPRPKLGRNNLLVEMMQKLSAVGLTKGPSAPPLCELLAPAESHSFEHATFDVSSVRPDGQWLLGETRRQLAAQITEKESEVQQLKQNLKSFSRMAKAAVKDSSRLFSELMEFLEHRRVEMKVLIRVQEKAELTRAENHLQHLEQQILELRRRDAELDRLTHVQDQRLVAQMCQSFGSPVPAEASSSLTVSPHVSFGPVRTAISQLKEQLESLYKTQFPSITSAVKNVNLVQMEKTNKALESCDPAHAPALDNRADLLQYSCPLSLDPFTAHRELSLTEGNRVVRRTGEIQQYPDHPDRFDSWVQVLCREGLQGRSYWEVEWDGQQVAVGLTYESIGRKGSSDHCRLGHNDLSWSLQCSSSSFILCHGNQKTTAEVPSGSVSRRIGVFLDHDVGLLCFYTVTPGGVHLLHRVETRFDMPLYPAVWLGASCTVTLCTLN